MPWGRRCDPGCASWPDTEDFKRCPTCGEKTTRYSNLQPMDPDEALSLKAHEEFEHFYGIWCRKNEQSESGPLPMSAEEAVYWDEKYPGGRPDPKPEEE